MLRDIAKFDKTEVEGVILESSVGLRYSFWLCKTSQGDESPR